MQGTGKEDLMPTNDLTTDLDFLRELCAAPAPTGFEAPAQEVLRRRLQGTAEPQSDPLGNLWADAPAEGTPHVVVTGHNDQIGLIVTYVDDKGFVYFDKIGGVDPQLLPGRHLVVNTAKGPVHGVVGRRPTHIIPKEERGKAAEITEQWLDIGAASKEEALALVAIGDAITFEAQFVALANGRFASPGFDNRAGVYVAFRGLELYARQPAAAKLTALATVHEETTFMGAKAMARRLSPDVMIVVDVDFASDDPGVDPKKLAGEVKLGGGPVIHRGAGSNLALVDYACQVAADEGIPVQIKAIPRQDLDRRRGAHVGRHDGDALVQRPAALHALVHGGHPAGRRRSRRGARGRAGAASRRGLDARALRAPRVAEHKRSGERRGGAVQAARPRPFAATAAMPSARRSAAASPRRRAARRRGPAGTGSGGISPPLDLLGALAGDLLRRRRPAATGHSEKLRLLRPSSTSRVDKPRGGRDVRVPRPDRLVAVAVEAGLLRQRPRLRRVPRRLRASPAGSSCSRPYGTSWIATNTTTSADHHPQDDLDAPPHAPCSLLRSSCLSSLILARAYCLRSSGTGGAPLAAVYPTAQGS